MDLAERKCESCDAGTEPLHDDVVDFMLEDVPNWRREDKWIHRDYGMKNFVAAVGFIRDIADIAEDEGHHPDLHLTGYKQLRVSMQTHKIGGLSDNDLILAAKIERLWQQTHQTP